jgi:oxygen-independent coproporphyrinogen-3 oxidase
MTITAELVQKLSKPGPRYTSYPTAPEWKAWDTPQSYIRALNLLGQSDHSVSLYVHIPFCPKMCYYCGCNVVIRKSNTNVGDEYIDYLEKELQLVTGHIDKKTTLKQVHLGGGTPNFLSSDQLRRLWALITTFFNIDPDAEIAIEIDPRTIHIDQLHTLKELGFNRISMGIQDFDPTVQDVINREQPFDMVQELIGNLRALNFTSINMDLIYGLPNQTLDSFSETIKKVISLNPDRIALYSFAYVPWLKSHQKLLVEKDIPAGKEKLDLFLDARDRFLKSGYDAIGMDHFAKKTDDIAKAYATGTLHRNFMGYTTKPADDYIGIGVTAIGYVSETFSQNTHELKDYYDALDRDVLPSVKGLVLGPDDLIRQWIIKQFMCAFQLDKTAFSKKFLCDFEDYFEDELLHLNRCEEEGLVTQTPTHIYITDLGRFFIRNVAMGFDAYLQKSQTQKKFSNTI